LKDKNDPGFASQPRQTRAEVSGNSKHSCFIRYGIKKFCNEGHCGLYYKPVMIVNDDSRVVNKLEASLTDDARVVIYNHHMLIVQATGVKVFGVKRLG
jgi:hypothetical protein